MMLGKSIRVDAAFFVDSIKLAALIATQILWTSLFTSPRAGLINLIPTTIFLTIWYLFIQLHFDKKRFLLYFLPGFLLTLRLPLTLSRGLEPLSWIFYMITVSLVLVKIWQHLGFKNQQKPQVLFLIITIALILFNAFGHLSLNSPYTYTFRLTNSLASDYSPGIDNNTTWECPYENPGIVVNCDMRHFIVSEKIFTQPNRGEAKSSVLLSRFFYGYLSSLIGFEGYRWFASFTLNVLFWIFACAAIFRLCILGRLSRNIAKISALLCTCSWGFIHFVGQPSPHVAAYAFAAITIWATIEIIHATSFKKALFLSLLIITGPLTYEVYPVSLTCLLLLLIFRRRVIAGLILLAQLLLVTLWKHVSLGLILGTLGNVSSKSSGIKNITHDFNVWKDIITRIDLVSGLKLVAKGLQSYTYGSFIVGAVAAFIFIIYLAKTTYGKAESDEHLERNMLLAWCFLLCTLTLLSTIFITPQSYIWSPNAGMQPRLSFFVYPANIIAMAFIADWATKNYRRRYLQYVPIIATFILSNLNVASIALMFDYGLVGLYWIY